MGYISKKKVRPISTLQTHTKLFEPLSTNRFSVYRFKKITWARNLELHTG